MFSRIFESKIFIWLGEESTDTCTHKQNN